MKMLELELNVMVMDEYYDELLEVVVEWHHEEDGGDGY